MTTVDRLRLAGADLEKMRIQPGDVLVLRGSVGTDALEVIGQYLVDHELAGVLIIELPEGGHLARADLAEMAAAGWVRAE